MIALATALLLTALAPQGETRPFGLRNADRVIFFGDSITQADHYVAFLEAYLITRFPDQTFEILNHGISSETISGISESDHQPRRPDAHDRFERDVAAWRPEVVFACFGMNDGIYAPFDEERIARYKEGVRRLIVRTQAINARLILMTPPPFDPYRRQVGDPTANDFGYKFPAIDYDATLERYAAWLVSLRDEGVEVIDLHSALNEALERRRQGDVSFYIAADAVHPGETGHWLMTQAILSALNAPAKAAEATIDLKAGEVRAGQVSEISRSGETWDFTWIRPLPAPVPADCDDRVLRLERTSERVNLDRLSATGLPARRYRVSIRHDEEWVMMAEAETDELSHGLSLDRLDRFVPASESARLLSELRRLRREEYESWRTRIARGLDGHPPESESTHSRATRLRLRDDARARPFRFRIEPCPAP